MIQGPRRQAEQKAEPNTRWSCWTITLHQQYEFLTLVGGDAVISAHLEEFTRWIEERCYADHQFLRLPVVV